MTVNAAVKREVVEAVGGFDERIGARPGTSVTGEDSLLAWRVREGGWRIFYQPDALVHHRISRGRMSRRFFLRRAYLEGVCLVEVEQRRGLLTGERRRSLLAFHDRRLRLRWIAAPLRHLSLAPWDDPRVLAGLGEVALSNGVVDACRRLEAAEQGA